jgi:hypothetical protein
MRSLTVLLVLLVACGDNNASKTDGGTNGPHDAKAHDAKVFEDAKVFMDAPPNVGDGIQEVRSAADGTVDLNVTNVTVTVVRPLIGSMTNDPAGFYVQSAQTGPGLYVEVDPTTLTPVPVPGDVVSFHVTAKETPGTSLQPRAKTIDTFTRSTQGADLGALTQEISNTTDLVSAVGNYDSELVTVAGTLVGAMGTSGTGFSKFELDTAGIAGNANLQLRLPTTVAATLDPIAACTVSATKVILNRFASTAEVTAINASDLHFACSESVVSAVATSSTSIQLTFARNIDTATVMADGSQFTADNGLTLSAPIVSNNLITLTTSAQTLGTTYTVTVANTVKDIDGDVVMAPGTVSFIGFTAPATVRINEVNANISLPASGCDLIELRVIADGSMAGFKITERNGGTGELTFTFPAGFNVHKNDYIVIHENSGSTTCNPNTATSETLTKIDQPAATFAGNYDTAFDFWVADPGLVATNNVITLFDAANAVTDAVFLSDVTDSAAVATLTAAAVVGTANQWTPAQTTYTAAEFDAAAVTDLNATGASAVGNSIQRINDTDTNAVADWTTGAGVTSTWGLNNAGQVDIP